MRRLVRRHYWYQELKELRAARLCDAPGTVAKLSKVPQDELGWFSKAIAFLTTPFKRCGISGWQPTGCDAKAGGTTVFDAGHSTDGFYTIDLRLETFVIQTVSMPLEVERYVRIEVEPKTGAHAACERLGGVLKGQRVLCGGPVVVDTDGEGFLEIHPGDDFQVV
jgi:hypothetical protein